MTGEHTVEAIIKYLTTQCKSKKIHIHTVNNVHHKQTSIILTIPHTVVKPK